MNLEIKPSILALLSEESREKARAFMQENRGDPRMEFLIAELSSEKPNYLDLFARGITHLPATTEQGGSAFATAYFFVLSQVESLPDKAISFALDASIYAQGAYEYDRRYQDFGLGARTLFKETVWPLLK